MRLRFRDQMHDPEPSDPRLPVRITLAQARAMHRHLLRPDGLEYQAYALARKVAAAEPHYRISELILTPASDYLEQGRAVVTTSPWALLHLLQRCCAEKPDLVLDLHSHPFAQVGWFSKTDDRDYPDFAGAVAFAVPGATAARWVWVPRLRRSRLEIGTQGSNLLSDLEVARFGVVYSQSSNESSPPNIGVTPPRPLEDWAPAEPRPSEADKDSDSVAAPLLAAEPLS